jgi:uncharacterized flavoprotein (TIGR03862 family)
VIGAGPAGLIAAERLAAAGVRVTVADRMPSPARKLLLAGRGGLNLTHSEPFSAFVGRYGEAGERLAAAIAAFPPDALRAWCEQLGQPVFTGTSGRVFPVAMKAAPLVRAWLRRLDGHGVAFLPRHRWTGWDGDALRFETSGGPVTLRADATLLALGGASWPRMGSDGGWVEVLRARGVRVATLRPSNCGVLIPWSDVFRDRFAGEPLKRIALTFGPVTVRGEAVVTRDGLEGGAVYALSAKLRDAAERGPATLQVDLRPDLDVAALRARLAAPRRGQSTANFLRRAGFAPVALGLLREIDEPADLASRAKALPLAVTGVQPIGRAISSAGGIGWEELDGCMLNRLPGVFAAGEMLDWEAPTGGYLLQACFSTGMAAAEAMLRRLG